MLFKRNIVQKNEINESLLFDQFSNIKKFYEENHENFKDLTISEKWVQLFKKQPDDYCSEFLKICHVFFAIPAHNANCERVFSFMSMQWTNIRNRLLPETVRAIIMVQYNLCKVYK